MVALGVGVGESLRGCSGGGVVALGGVHGFIRGVCGFIWGVHGFIWGACVVLFGGCAWFYLGGHVWFYSGDMCGFIQGGMRGFIWGGGMPGFFTFFGYNEIRSMSGRYASYWNAFLFQKDYCSE